MSIFDQRSSDEEIMDDLSYEGEILDKTLQELHFINTWLGGNHVILSGLEELVNGVQKKLPDVLRIADLGCGGGDLMKLMANWAKKKKLKVEITGIDANAYTVAYAKKNTQDFPEIIYKSINIHDPQFAQTKFDIITCTLFCHHFDQEQLALLFAQFKNQVTLGIVINDIHRHWFAYHSIRILTSLFSKSYMVQHDAKLSVLRAFKKSELVELFEKTGYSKFNISWKWAFRYQAVGWK